MPTQHNTFSLSQISISAFSFEKNNEFNHADGNIKISLKQGFGAEYIKTENGVHVFLETEINALADKQEIFSASASIDVEVKSDDIDDIPLQNIVAIMYSYLRPLVAQMTIFAKLPPLDLPPLNFSDFEVEERTNEEIQDD